MNLRMRRIHRIHFVGIGGSGMCGIAEVLANQGYDVQGSDLKPSPATERLAGLGVDIRIGHDASHVAEADVLVASSAIDEDNVELKAAQAARMPIVARAEMLGELMRFSRRSVAVAGTHGKTTTTSLVAAILAEADLDPTFIIGGRLKGADSNARLGASDYLVAEADESDASFHHLQPLVAIVTNIDADHLSTYGNDIGRLRHAFLEFLHNLPFYGLAVVCTDDAGVRAVLPELGRSSVTYGLEAGADVHATDVSFERDASRFTVHRAGRDPMAVTLGLPGEHNVRNALAAIAVATDFDVPDAAVQSALANFGGIDRRFQALGSVTVAGGEATLVDDYGHHPTEIAATVAAARRGWPQRRLVLVFQPHRYTRTNELLDDFAAVLSEVDVLVLLDVYAAGETPIAGADGRALARAVRQRGAVEPVFVEDTATLPETLARVLEDHDLVLTMGAGDVGAIARGLPDALADAVAALPEASA